MIRSPLAKIRNRPAQQSEDPSRSEHAQKGESPVLRAVKPEVEEQSHQQPVPTPTPSPNPPSFENLEDPQPPGVASSKQSGQDWSAVTVSGIKDLDQRSRTYSNPKNILPPLRATMHDSARLQLQRFLKITGTLLSTAILIFVVTTNWFQENVLLRIQFFLAGEDLLGGGDKKKGSSSKTPSSSQRPMKTISQVKALENSELFSHPELLQARILESHPTLTIPNCRKSLDLFYEKNQLFTVTEYAAVGECLLLAHDYGGAAKIYAQFGEALRMIPEAKFKSKVDYEIHTELFYGYLVSHIYAGELRQASEMVRGRCPQWVFSHSCVGKTIVYAFQKVPLDPEGQKLFEILGALPPAAQSRLLLAGAMLAAQEGRTRVADQRVKTGLKKIPGRAQHLKRMFYDFWSVELFHRGMFILLKSFTDASFKSLRSSLHGGLVRLRFLRDSSRNLANKKVLEAYLTSLDTRIEVSRDPDFLDILGTQALRLQMLEEWEKFLKAARKELDMSPQASQRTLDFFRNSSLWLARSYLARGQYLPAIKVLSDSRDQFQNDPVATHLRGVAYFLLSDQSSQQLNATAELTKAFKLRRNWETLVVLGFALAKTGKKDTLVSIIKDLNSMVTTSGQKYWVELLKGEFYLSQGKLVSAQKIAQDLLYSDPTAVVPRLLLIRALSQMGKIEDIKKEQSKLEEATRKTPYAGSFEALASPFGPLSLGKRPID